MATADNTSIRVSWQWSRQGVLMCVDLVRVHYQSDDVHSGQYNSNQCHFVQPPEQHMLHHHCGVERWGAQEGEHRKNSVCFTMRYTVEFRTP